MDTKIEEITFGSWLRKQRRMQDITRQALADQAGCAEITLRRIENGTLKPSKELTSILLEKLGIPEHERPQLVQFARGLTEHPERPVSPSPAKLLTNLPALLTTFIGRENERAEIIQALNKHRLVTLTGSGGVGKTRLAIEVGGQTLGNYANGVWLAELASLNDPTLLPQTIIALLGLVTYSNDPLDEVLINFLRAKTVLLILDNCEHLLDSCARLANTLLKNCPNLKILVTSREALGILGEVTFRVPSLQLPNVHESTEKIKGYESMRLFEERAQLALADFILTKENASSVAQICSRLDGIPLAIELATAHLVIFSVEQLAERLNESFQVLTSGNRTALPHHQTIRASIDWSWNLISDLERMLLRRLAIFAGGWILEAAESICGDNGIEAHEISKLMSQLVAKSLVIANPALGGKRRFHLHETIRQYALEKLTEAGEENGLRSLHLKYFLGLSLLDEPALHGSRQIEWFSQINDERGNIRIAMEQASKMDLEAGLILAGRLGRYWENFDLREGLNWTTEFVQNEESRNFPQARAIALQTQGVVLWYLQQFESARSAVEESLALSRACGDQQGEFESLMLLGAIVQFLESMEEKVKYQKQALALAVSSGDTWGRARALSALGWDQRDPEQARDYWEESIGLFRQLEDWHYLVHTLGIMGFTVLSNGDVETAQHILDQAEDANVHTNDNWGMEFVLTGKGYIALMRGEYAEARALLQKNADFLKEVGNQMGYLWARARLGHIALREGQMAQAHQILTEIIASFKKDNNRSGLAFVLERMASLFVAIDKPREAARLIGWSDATRRSVGEPRPRLEQMDLDPDIAVIRTKIGNTSYEEAYREGHALTLDQAVAHALEEIRL
jgi:predicted ATPase